VDVTQVEQLLSTAVAGGAAAAAQGQVTAAVNGAVTSLRGVLRRVFGSDPVALEAVDKLQGRDLPAGEAQVWHDRLGERLVGLPEADLRELIARAREVLGNTDPDGTAAGRYVMDLDLRDAKGVQVNQGGSGQSQTNTFS
jgi:hypothetical protein